MALAADAEWQACGSRQGVGLEKQAVPGSSYYTYRARAHVSVPAEQVIASIWTGVLVAHPPSVVKRTILKHDDNEIVVYDLIHSPVVSDRDVTTRLRKVVDPHAGRFEIQFDAANDLGPPSDGHHVRLPVVRGSWRVEVDPAGGVNLIYSCYSEPGGSVPAFLVRGAQQDSLANEFNRVLSRLRT